VSPDGSAHGTLTIDTASVDTKQAKRDTHLRSADFFDVDNHPSIIFIASGATANSDGTVEVTGELTVRGHTRPLIFTTQASETSANAVTLTADLSINRTDFDMTWNQFRMMKPLTSVTVAARFTRQPA
jgi:polyisoprenoid-binding protein YceI